MSLIIWHCPHVCLCYWQFVFDPMNNIWNCDTFCQLPFLLCSITLSKSNEVYQLHMFFIISSDVAQTFVFVSGWLILILWIIYGAVKCFASCLSSCVASLDICHFLYKLVQWYEVVQSSAMVGYVVAMTAGKSCKCVNMDHLSIGFDLTLFLWCSTVFLFFFSCPWNSILQSLLYKLIENNYV